MVNVRVPGVSIKACNQYSKCVASCKTSLLLSVHTLIVYKIKVERNNNDCKYLQSKSHHLFIQWIY